MANFDIETLSNDLYTKANWPAGVAFRRTNPLPIDKYSIFYTKKAAEDYALTGAVAYPGQFVAVIDTNDPLSTTTAYVIEVDRTLKALATGGSAEEILQKLNAEIVRAEEAESGISADLSTLRDETLPLSVATLEQNLSVDLIKQETAEATFLATYYLTQGGQQVGAKINIPKDFLVKKASIGTTTAEDLEEGGKFGPGTEWHDQFEVGDKYIDFLINAKEAEETEQHLYINIKNLVNDYTGDETTTISVGIDHVTNKIAAAIKTGSITRDLLSTDITTELDGLRDDIDALSTYADETFETKADATSKYNDLTGQISDEIDAREAADAALEASAALSVENLSTTVDSWLTDSTNGYVSQDVTTDNKIATIKDIVGLSGVVHFRGASETFDGTTTKPSDVEWYQTHDPSAGDIVINSKTSKEYLFDGTKWLELGDEGLYATKQELSDEIERAEAAEKALSDMVEAEAARADDVEQFLSGAIDDEVARATAAESDLSDMVKAEEARALDAEKDLSDAIIAETSRAEGVEDELSTAIKQKVWIKDAATEKYATGDYGDLSVVKVTEDEYMEKVADGTLLKDGVLYVISSDHINAYGQQIVNLAEPTLSGDAATKNYVDVEVKKVADAAVSSITLNGLEFDFTEKTAPVLNIGAIKCGSATELTSVM